MEENKRNKDDNDIKEHVEDLKEDVKVLAKEILKNTKDNKLKFDKKDIEENKTMACLAYIIAPIPYFIKTKSKWVKYHAIQGMNLLIIDILLSLLVYILSSLILWPFLILKVLLRLSLYSVVVIYSLIGIIHVCNCETKELPIIDKIKLIKK